LTKKNIDVKFICADILKLKIKKKYDVIIIMAVLHHLIGKSRKESKKLAEKAISNCLKILKKDGSLIIFEPVFSNYLMMDILFYLKKIFSKISNKRITLFGHWNNIGAPVVSYFSQKSLIKTIKQNGGMTEKSKYILAKPKIIYKLLNIERGDLYLQIKKS
jgi:SAM-dependent methyltransferase